MVEKKNSLGFWLSLELFINFFVVVSLVPLVASFKPFYLGIFIWALFMIWGFKPLIFVVRDYYEEKKLLSNKKTKREDSQEIMKFVFWIVFFLGFLLLINRTFFPFLPNSSWKILLDHIVGGFLITILFYMLFLGMITFFQPKIKIEYKIRWFIFASLVTIIISFIWEGIFQNFSSTSQIIADLFGLALSWAYFLIYREIKD